jgi:hypothetical protein
MIRSTELLLVVTSIPIVVILYCAAPLHGEPLISSAVTDGTELTLDSVSGVDTESRSDVLEVLVDADTVIEEFTDGQLQFMTLNDAVKVVTDE